MATNQQYSQPIDRYAMAQQQFNQMGVEAKNDRAVSEARADAYRKASLLMMGDTYARLSRAVAKGINDIVPVDKELVTDFNMFKKKDIKDKKDNVVNTPKTVKLVNNTSFIEDIPSYDSNEDFSNWNPEKGKDELPMSRGRFLSSLLGVPGSFIDMSLGLRDMFNKESDYGTKYTPNTDPLLQGRTGYTANTSNELFKPMIDNQARLDDFMKRLSTDTQYDKPIGNLLGGNTTILETLKLKE